ncbi:T9SS C-terminal target domain-containing protein [Croceivirga lutea]|uniref:T9SS type A sorting domain-containing protein n=1 Tax=Croceivirga lutea TaxID=1775167 RepID=UPI00163AEC42|nr:T9SS type A sorting domain-containing protein [Croceivirga lutea]GGG45735.1 T9SS C-terminal target domain-containing protein [Croceivirga lutea]
MKTVIVILLSILYHQGYAQTLKRQTLSVAGNSNLVVVGQGSFFLQQSVGQNSVINTYVESNHSLRQGFVQPLPAIVLGGDPNELEVVVYPNPFVNGVVVNLEPSDEERVEMQLFDISGRLILQNSYAANTQLQIPLYNLAEGSYLMTLKMGRQYATHQLLKL